MVVEVTVGEQNVARHDRSGRFDRAADDLRVAGRVHQCGVSVLRRHQVGEVVIKSPDRQLPDLKFHISILSHGQCKRRVVADLLPELCRDDPAVGRRRRNRLPAEALLHRRTDPRFRAGEDAADDDPFRIEQIDQKGEAAPEPAAAFRIDRACERIAFVGGDADRLCGDTRQVGLRGAPGNPFAALERLLRSHGRELSDAAAGAEPFEGARFAETDRTERGEADVAALPGEVTAAGVEPPVEDQPGAETGAEGEEDERLNRFPRPVLPFGDRSGVGVVLEPE